MNTLDWLNHRKGEAALAELKPPQVPAPPDPITVCPEKSPRIPEPPIFDDLQINIFLEAEKIIDHSTSRIGPLGDSRGFIEVCRAEKEIPRGNIGDDRSNSDQTRGSIGDYLPDHQQKADSIAVSEPHLLADGTLVIPFTSDPKYHWWKGGQSISQTRAELLADGHHAQVAASTNTQKGESDGTSI